MPFKAIYFFQNHLKIDCIAVKDAGVPFNSFCPKKLKELFCLCMWGISISRNNFKINVRAPSLFEPSTIKSRKNFKNRGEKKKFNQRFQKIENVFTYKLIVHC